MPAEADSTQVNAMHFLVATDGSPESDVALEHAVDLAGAAGAKLTVVHAVTPRIRSGGIEPTQSLSDAERRLIVENIEEAEARGEAILEDAAREVSEAGVEVDTEMLYGDPVEAVAEYAAADAHDGLFVGHRGLSDRAEALLGSTASELLRRAPVPVTVVR